MNARDENRLSMFVAVFGVLTDNKTLWQTVVAILNAYNALEGHIKAIGESAVTHTSSTKGVTEVKRMARVAMTESAVAVAGGVRAYASSKGDAELLAKVDLWPSDFARERDTEVAGLCQGVHDTANGIVALLTD
jgi:hypothetical protein